LKRLHKQRVGLWKFVCALLTIGLCWACEGKKESDPNAFATVGNNLPRKSSLFLGTQYYRPPNPRPEDWDRDLDLIKQDGLEVVRVWVYWSQVNPHPGEWRWDNYDRFFALANKHKLKVLIQLMPEMAPYWFEARFPRTSYKDREGGPIEYYSAPSGTFGEYPGPCVHNKKAKEAMGEFMRRTVERYRSLPNLLAYDVWNEVGLPECYCQATQSLYKSWLKTRYSEIGILNRKYGRSYSSFSETRIPKNGVYGEMFDYAEFFLWTEAEELRWRAETVRAVDRTHMVVSHGGGFYGWYVDPWSLAGSVDKWGGSDYSGAGRHSLRPEDFHEIALIFNTIRDSAQGRPWWVAEMPAGSVWNGLGVALRTDAELRMQMLLGFGFGAEGVLLWQWRPEIYGQEASNYGVTGFDGEPTSRTETVRQVAEMLQKQKPIFDCLEWPQPQVGLVWDISAAMYEHYNGEFYSGLRPLPEEESLVWNNFLGIYSGLVDEGYDVQILNARLVAESGVPQEIKVVFDPFQVFDRAGLSARFKAWVEKGGTLVAGPLYGLYDPDTYVNKHVPPNEIAEVFGVRHRQRIYPPDPSIHLNSDVPIGDLHGTLRGHLLVELFRLEGATALGTHKNKPVLTINKFGRGHGIMLGSFVGVNYFRPGGRQLAKFLSAICASSGASPQAKASGGIIVRVAHSRQDYLAFLFNPFDHPVKTTFNLGESNEFLVVDLLGGRELGRTKAGMPLGVELKAKDSKVLLARPVRHRGAGRGAG